MRWVTENKQIEVQVSKVLSFKPQVGKAKTDQTTGGFIVISPKNKISQDNHNLKAVTQ